MIPIRTIDFTNPADKAGHDRIVALVEQTKWRCANNWRRRPPRAGSPRLQQVKAGSKPAQRSTFSLLQRAFTWMSRAFQRSADADWLHHGLGYAYSILAFLASWRLTPNYGKISGAMLKN
ncbi:MAG: hypothetical protein DPW09_01010 [Anaerolineae bacterium]|nr:hypothetical protein [Anaerolineales bacterium]MCQ3972003.1 hypothetical protein [Anaerolineae bacterium]